MPERPPTPDTGKSEVGWPRHRHDRGVSVGLLLDERRRSEGALIAASAKVSECEVALCRAEVELKMARQEYEWALGGYRDLCETLSSALEESRA